jgi:UDP-2-acetamido-2,6-beta-L-arabino-hexul-4-ose reductase
MRTECFEGQGGPGMIKALITGGRGFLGRNLTVHLRGHRDCETMIYGREDSPEDLDHYLGEADIVFHLAGVNRPENPSEFEKGNAEFTESICRILQEHRRAPRIVFSSSSQAELDNAYGASKRRAESALRRFSAESGAGIRIYRLSNLFGKWCRPNYNSVTATFCHNIANELPITLSDPAREVQLSFVDDVVAAFVADLGSQFQGVEEGRVIPNHRIQLGDLAGRIQSFHDMRSTITLPDFSDWFNRALYATYLSYVPLDALQGALDMKADARGSLAEFLKQKSFGQVFISRTKPGITRGNHFHHCKTEKFFVVEGEGLIRMRSVEGGPVKEFAVQGSSYEVVDIPPGFTHSITNVGDGAMVTIFWSSEIFDPTRLDTYYLPVDFEAPEKVSVERA